MNRTVSKLSVLALLSLSNTWLATTAAGARSLIESEVSPKSGINTKETAEVPIAALAQAELVLPEASSQQPEEAGAIVAIAVSDQSPHQAETTIVYEATALTPQLAQVDSAVVITDITVESTDAGLQVRLETAAGQLATPDTSTSGNALILEIPNAALAEGEFAQFEPAAGIALIQASELSGDLVRVVITGTDAPPQVDIRPDGTGLALGVTTGIAQASNDEEVIQIGVTGEDQDDYVVPNATTATRTDTPLRDVPQSIQVIPQQVLEDQGTIRLNDAVRNVSGVVTSSNDPRGQRFIIRGFDSASVLRDGFRLTDGATGNSGFPELANIEQIEVLKGPAAILFGSLEPGGVINLVSERPLSEPFYELSFRGGNRTLVEPSVDLSGPLTEDGRILYRLNTLYRREDYFRDFTTPVERFFIAPVVSFAINERTDLTVELEYRDDERPNDFGLVAVGDEVADIPFDRALNDRDARATAELVRTGYQFEHRFSDDWKLRNAFYFTQYETSVIVGFGSGFNEATGTVFSAPARLDQPSDSYELQTNVVGEFSTGSVDHTLLAGVDFYRRQDSGTEARGDVSIINTFNIFDPDYDNLITPDFDAAPILLSSEGTTDGLGIYVQDQISLLDNLKLLVGLRYDTVDQENFSANFFNPTGTETTRFDEAFSPRLGLVYQPVEELSLYTSYSQSFAPNFGNTESGDTLEPEQGEQFEVGARAELLEGRLVAGLALFNVTKQNVSTADPNNSLFVVAVGEQRSRGVELDVIGEILPGWNVVANYAYTDTEITEDNDGLEGNQLFGVPEHNFNLWTNYEIQQGDLAGLGFGIGVSFVGERFGDNANSFMLDEYFLTNAAISYQRDNWQAGLNFRNLFDVDYIESAENNRFGEINPGEGFTVVGSFSIAF
ncbi:MAG: TonB-dependent receptor [Leptolyngbya sp. SIOISBB]|nr:TonB-dependent receptor [Leptolyngbya sp. SIOISBB]